MECMLFAKMGSKGQLQVLESISSLLEDRPAEQNVSQLRTNLHGVGGCWGAETIPFGPRLLTPERQIPQLELAIGFLHSRSLRLTAFRVCQCVLFILV